MKGREEKWHHQEPLLLDVFHAASQLGHAPHVVV